MSTLLTSSSFVSQSDHYLSLEFVHASSKIFVHDDDFSSSSSKLTMKKKKIELNLNSDNILSKKMKKTRQSKKQIYAVHLDNDSHESLSTFYESFSSLLSTRNYYFSVDFSASSSAALAAVAINQSSIAKLSILFERLHRDILSSKSINYCQILKHSQRQRFIQIMNIELKTL